VILAFEIFEEREDKEPGCTIEMSVGRGCGNPMHLWRTIELIKLLPNLNPEDFGCVLCATTLDQKPEVINCFLEDHDLSREQIESIMNAEVPQDILSLIPKFFELGHLDSPEITKEVKLGKIQWNSNFSDCEILHPKQDEILTERLVSLIDKYEICLSKFSRYNDLQPRNEIFRRTRFFLLKLAVKDLDSKHEKLIMVASAAALAKIEFFEERIKNFAATILEFEITDEEFTISAIKEEAEWIAKEKHSIFWKFFTNKYQKILQDIILNWEDMETTHPLYPAIEDIEI